MATECPDNSTECLLRAILEANSGYNWNPITFGFTAVFTIIAFVVSVVALVQSLVVAGPGRLKASERAIGVKQHRQRADTRFSWKEFRFRTIVNVPVIDISKILESADAVIPVRGSGSGRRDLPTLTHRPSVVAGWSQLLNDLSLTDINFNTIECLTDYVPDDVAVSPAWARVESIILLSIMKDCTRLVENEDGFINATGPSAQLAWNMHPSLGPIAAYRTWDIKETSLHQLHDVQRMIPVFLGELYLSGHKLYKPLRQRRDDVPVWFDFTQLKAFCAPSWERCHHQHDHCLNRARGLWAGYLAHTGRDGSVNKQTAVLASALFADRPAYARAFPTRVTRIHSALKDMYEEYFPWLILANDLDDHVLQTLCGSSFIEFDSHEATSDRTSLDDVKLTSWLKGASRPDLIRTDEPLELERPTLNQLDTVSGRRFGKTVYQGLSSEKIESSILRISRPAVAHVSRWLSDDTYFQTATYAEVSSARKWLTYQLAELDWFLSSVGHDSICAASNLVALGTTKFGVVQFTKLSRRFIMPETLDAFNLSWATKPGDDSLIIVKGYLDPETIQRLFAYTRTYIERNRREVHTVKCDKATQGYYYASNKWQPKSAHKDKPDVPISTESDAMLDANSRLNDSSSATENVEEGSKSMRVDSNNLSEQSSNPFTAETNTLPDSKSISGLTKPLGDTELHDILMKDTGAGKASDEDEVLVRVDLRIAALEALAFFRAEVFGALLATGTDTSLIMTSEKRYQLVQVQ